MTSKPPSRRAPLGFVEGASCTDGVVKLKKVPCDLPGALEHRRVAAVFHPHHAHVSQAPFELLDRRLMEKPVRVAPDDECRSSDAREVLLELVGVLRVEQVPPD